MNPVEQMRWAKSLLEEKSGGAFELVAGNVRGDLFLRCSDKAHVGLYLTMQPNMKTGRYDCQFQGYTRISSGYHDARGMQRVAVPDGGLSAKGAGGRKNHPVPRRAVRFRRRAFKHRGTRNHRPADGDVKGGLHHENH